MSKIWQDTTIQSKKHTFMEDFCSGLRKRLVITHIGSSEGFQEDG